MGKNHREPPSRVNFRHSQAVSFCPCAMYQLSISSVRLRHSQASPMADATALTDIAVQGINRATAFPRAASNPLLLATRRIGVNSPRRNPFELLIGVGSSPGHETVSLTSVHGSRSECSQEQWCNPRSKSLDVPESNQNPPRKRKIPLVAGGRWGCSDVA